MHHPGQRADQQPTVQNKMKKRVSRAPPGSLVSGSNASLAGLQRDLVVIYALYREPTCFRRFLTELVRLLDG